MRNIQASAWRAAMAWMAIVSVAAVSTGHATEEEATRMAMLRKNAAEAVTPEPIQPFTRPVVSEETLLRVRLDPAEWVEMHAAKISENGGTLRVTATGFDPYVGVPTDADPAGGRIFVRMRCRGNCGTVQIFQSTIVPIGFRGAIASRDIPMETHGFLEETSTRVAIPVVRNGAEDDGWCDVTAEMPDAGRIVQLRFDPGNNIGDFCEFAAIELVRQSFHPLEISQMARAVDGLAVTLKNHAAAPLRTCWRMESPDGAVMEGTADVDGNGNVELRYPLPADYCGAYRLAVECDGLPTIHRATYIVAPTNSVKATNDAVTGECTIGDVRIRWSGEDAAGRVTRLQIGCGDRTIAMFGPLAWRMEIAENPTAENPTAENREKNGSRKTEAEQWFGQDVARRAVRFSPPGTDGNMAEMPADCIIFRGEDGVTLTISAGERRGDRKCDLLVRLTGATPSAPLEGPVIRMDGGLRGGQLAGVEYLGCGGVGADGNPVGDASSSKLDCITKERLRYLPDPLKVTYPYMMQRTGYGSVALVWDDPQQVRPVYATPDCFDETLHDGINVLPSHRMALVASSNILLTMRVSDDSTEESILWSVAALGGLPELPVSPRSRAESNALYLRALVDGPLRGPTGWGHCIGPGWAKTPVADQASTIWQLSGEKIRFSECPTGYLFGGAHIRNDAIFFVTGDAAHWKNIWRGVVDRLITAQQPDGSYRYDDIYAAGHFETTALGIDALPAMQLLEYAYLTGNSEAMEAGLRTLDHMRHFDVPRGAQCWEIPLHSPDQLASAYAVIAYLRGYELTGRGEYLAEARRWAITGIPFTYLRSDPNCPVMAYSTTPVYGATFWTKPMWVGLPVQWVGGVYAYAVARLAEYDDSFDWRKLARGIQITAEQMIYPDGENAGTLPDSFTLASQQRNPADINPCAIVSLQRLLDGLPETLSTAVDADGNRYTAPYPIRIENGRAVIDAPPGETYEFLRNGEIMSSPSSATDADTGT